MAHIGFVGIRGMVGNTLVKRMIEEGDLSNNHKYSFFSSTQVGQKITDELGDYSFEDANDVQNLKKLDILVSTQGSEYTDTIIKKLRDDNWQGYLIDASSALRMNDDAIIVLDPINKGYIQEGINSGIKNFVGGNCTVSLLMMAISGLIKNNLIDWISTMTYQAISGAGAKQITELMRQVQSFNFKENQKPLELERNFNELVKNNKLPMTDIGYPLAFNLMPWIDKGMEDGRTREEWKGEVEFNKILNTKKMINVDGICVRVPTFRSHAQAATIKLKENIDIQEIEKMIVDGNEWVKYIPNNQEDSFRALHPIMASEKLDIFVGRLRKLTMGEKYLGLFTVGDQLLWGAAEPIRRALKIILEVV